MSQENVEVIRRAHDAAFRGDVDTMLSCCHPEVIWEENTTVFPGLRERYEGHAEVREWFEEAVVNAWSELHVERTEITPIGADRVLLDTTFTARGRGSGVETRLRFWQVFWLADRTVRRRQLFLDEASALEAAGPRE